MYHKGKNIFTTPFLCSLSRNVLLPPTFFHSRFQAVDLHLSHIPFKFTTKPDLSSDSEQIPREHYKVKSIYDHYAEKSRKEISFAIHSLNPWGVGSGTGRKGHTVET